MSQPTPSAGYSSAGITTVVWGTDGLLQSPSPGGSYAGTGYFIVVSLDESEKIDLDYGENGTGIEVRRTVLKHGFRWNLTVEDDTQMTPPSVNSTVQVVHVLGNQTTSYTAVVINNDYRSARKQPGQRILQVENLTLVDSQTTTGV